MTVVIESDHAMYLCALNMRSDWFFLVLITFWQMIHCSQQSKTNSKAVKLHDAVVKFDRLRPTHRNLQRHRAVSSPCDSTAFLLLLQQRLC